MLNLKSKLTEGLKKSLYFNEPYLNPEDPRCTSSEYFKEISYMVELQDLYKIHGSCYYHDEMKYVPILLEIMPEKVRKGYNDAKYLLQAWDKEKNKIFQKELHHAIKLWQICYQYLIYTLDESAGEEAEYTYIVDFENNNHIVKIHNFGVKTDVKFLSYVNQKLFAGTTDQIFVCSIPSSNFNSDGTTISTDDYKVRVITPGIKIHGFLLNEYCSEQGFQLIALENKQNILDFNRLFIDNIDDDDTYAYRWTQYREIMPRKAGYTSDPISKVRFIFAEGFNYSLTLLESGHFELYWNMMRREQPEDKFAIDIELTTDAFYFRLTDGNTYMFYHRNQSAVSFAQAEPISEYDLEWDNIKIKKIQNYVYLYTGFKIFCLYGGAKQKSFVSISHGKYISIFNITDWKWTNHLEFQDDVITQFMHKTNTGDLFTSCLTKQGWIYIGFMYDGGNWQSVVQKGWAGCFTEGSILMTADDLENSEYLFTLSKDSNGTKHLSMMYQKQLVKYDNLITDQARCSIACVRTKGNNCYVVIQNGPKVQLFQCMKQNDVNQPVLMKEFPVFKEITGHIHSACTFDTEKCLFLFDEKNMYVIQWTADKAATCTTYTDLYCIGINHFTPQYNYALCQDRPGAKSPGLRLFDMESIIRRKQDGMVLIKSIDVGTQGFFEYSFNLIRIGFVRSLTHLAIIPILHRNMNKFMGMAEPSAYICYKIFMDKMMALTQDGTLFTWVLSTGKMISSYKLDGHDYSDYDLHSVNKKGMVLLKSKEVITDVNESEYFQPYQFETSMENQTVVSRQGFHKFRNWKWIEIINEKSVKVQMEYVHPAFDYQKIFINQNRDRMIEGFQNYKTFFWRRITPDPENPHKVKWEFIRAIEDFPSELNNNVETLEFFSPCFSRYMICDHKRKQYIVKDTYLDKVVNPVPKELMTFESKALAYRTLNRFRWLDSGSFLLVNEEGIEKIIDIDNEFKEVAYNLRPLFNEIEKGDPEWYTNQYYLKRSNLGASDTLQRLQRCYQTYKTSYFLFNKRSNSELYQELISVDPHQFNYPVMSFSFLHWSLIEQIASGKMSFGDLEIPVVQQIIYNILPGGNTVLHKLADFEQELIKVFSISHPDLQNEEQEFHVPFLPNLNGQTPIHMCVQKQDYKSIDTILKYLKYYPTDHHSRGINDLYGEMIEKELPEFLLYLDSRFQQTMQTKKITKGCLKDNSNGLVTCELWYKENDFQGKLMQERPIETRIKCEILDLPGVYHYNEKEFQQMFEALSNTDQIEFFNLRSVQKLVEFNYPLVRRYVIRRLFIPFCIFQVVFFYFMNFVYEDMENPLSQILFYPLLFVNLIFATYFFVNEVRQLVGEGVEYFKSFWNYIDLVPPIGIYIMGIIVTLKYFQIDFDLTIERSILSIVTFFMWMKFLYFLRIFKNTGYLIRMISEVVVDMRHFFLVLLICIAAFGDSLLTLSYGNPADGEDRFIHGFVDSLIYTYRMILGDFDTGAFGQVAQPLVMGMFLLCTVFNMIVMLNLLIAIISDSYARVTSLSEQATYQERASMIAENNYLIPDSVKEQYAEQNKYLMVVTDLEAEQAEVKDPIIEEISYLKEYINKEVKQISKSIEETNSRLENQEKKSVDDNALLKRFILATMPKIPYTISLHDKPVYQTLFENLRLRFPESYPDGWFCDGKDKQGMGCRDPNNSNGLHPDVGETQHYHCKDCKFDFCDQCYAHYGAKYHHHPLEKLSMTKINEIHDDSYATGWYCDGRGIRDTFCKQLGRDQDPFSTLYHCDIDGLDFCETCFEKFRQ